MAQDDLHAVPDTEPAKTAQSTPRFAAVPSAPRHLWIYFLAVLALPIVVLWHQDNALYSPPYYADPWFYLGFFRDLVEYKRYLFYGTYYGSRLSWILPGFLVHSIFSPVVANCVLHLTVQSVATLSFFYVLRWTAGVRVAFLATIVFAVNPWLWVATGWDYPDGIGIAYCLLAMALLTRSAVRPTGTWTLILSGATLAAMVYTHVFLATLAPLIVLYYAGLLWAWHRQSVIPLLRRSTLRASLSFLGLTILFCFANYALDGNVWFYLPSIRQAFDLAGNFRFVRSIWFQHQLVPWLWPAVAGSVVAILLVPIHLKKKAASSSAPSLLFSVLLLLAVAYMGYLQVRGTTVLGHYPYVSYLLPFIFLVLGVSFWPAVETMRGSTYIVICSLSCLAFAALWYNPYQLRIPSFTNLRGVITLTALCAVCALLLRRRSVGTLLAMAGFTAFTAVGLIQTVYFGGVDLHGNREQYKRIMQARERIEGIRKGRDLRFWFDRQEPNAHEYEGLNALYLEEFTQIGTSFPKGCGEPVDPDTVIVVLSQQPHTTELARGALADCWGPFGMRPAVLEDTVVDRPERPYHMAFLRAAADVTDRPEDLFQSIPLEDVRLADRHASMKLQAAGLELYTNPHFGAFAARVSLDLNSALDSKLAVHVRARVRGGKVGFGILNSESKAFLRQFSLRPSAETSEIVLPLPVPTVVGDLVITNTAPGNIVSNAIVEKIEIRKVP